MAFNPDDYLKKEKSGGGEFNPDSYLQKAKSGGGSDTDGAGQAALESFGNAATFGYLPHIQSGVEQLRSAIDTGAAKLGIGPETPEMVDEKLRAKGFNIVQPKDNYVNNRDANIKRQEQQGKDFPVASALGTVGGTIAGGLAIPGGFIAKGATRMARIGRGAALGGAMGLLQNPGDVEGDVSLMPNERLSNAGKGAVFGGAAQGVLEALPLAAKAGSWLGKKVSSTLTGVSEGDIKTYAARTNEVNKMIRESGGDMTEAADKVRRELTSGIQKTKQTLNGQISAALESAPKAKTLDIDAVLSPLEKSKSALLNNHQVEEAAQVDAVIKKVKNFGFDKDSVYGASQYTGKVNAQELNNIKGMLQDIATPAYDKSGQIFNYSKDSQRAAKSGGAIARKMLNEISPDVAKANNQLSLMHGIEDNLNRNLLAAGKSDSALMAAGAGENPRNAKMLQKLGELSGTPIVEQAQNLSAARSFANPSFIPTDKTGKAAARMAAAAGIGGLVAGPVGAVVSGAVASPMSLKLGINASNSVGKLLAKVPGIAERAGAKPGMFDALVARVTQSIQDKPKFYKIETDPILNDPEQLEIFRQTPALIEQISDPNRRALLKEKLKRLPASR